MDFADDSGAVVSFLNPNNTQYVVSVGLTAARQFNAVRCHTVTATVTALMCSPCKEVVTIVWSIIMLQGDELFTTYVPRSSILSCNVKMFMRCGHGVTQRFPSLHKKSVIVLLRWCGHCRWGFAVLSQPGVSSHHDCAFLRVDGVLEGNPLAVKTYADLFNASITTDAVEVTLVIILVCCSCRLPICCCVCSCSALAMLPMASLCPSSSRCERMTRSCRHSWSTMHVCSRGSRSRRLRHRFMRPVKWLLPPAGY